jgi:hypothetical protein
VKIIINRLSGWKRLWVFLVIIYFFSVAFFTVVLLPKEEDLKREWAYAIIDFIRTKEDKLSKRYSSARELLNTLKGHEGYESYDEIIDKAQSKQFGGIHEKYKQKLSNLQREKMKVIGIGFLFWVIPSIIVYILGMGIGWIYRGFRGEK